MSYYYVAANLHKIVRNFLQNLHSLVSGAVNEQALAKVVSIIVNHQ